MQIYGKSQQRQSLIDAQKKNPSAAPTGFEVVQLSKTYFSA
jgi:hypothetical protein